ncbi:MAG: C69 family dipeptidase [Promethearchaeota archaeon]
MCDTLVALGSATEDGRTIFAKNSDRPSDEVQLVVFVPEKKYKKGEKLKCTYISIPQVEKTAAILISQPYWMWGAEMGINEYGVAIGNEAVWTTQPLNYTGLLGMDLLRLGLERGTTAFEALKHITSLLEKYGQGGACSIDGGMNYHNSFLIADNNEAWILETAGQFWVAEKITDGVRNISNELSISNTGDMRHKELLNYAIEKGLCKDEDSFNFAKIFSEYGWSPNKSPYSREGRCYNLLNKYKGKITPKVMAKILRDHEGGICMHGGFISAGSQISYIPKNQQNTNILNWFTLNAPPCKAIYIPFNFTDQNKGTEPEGPYNSVKNSWIWVQCENNQSKISEKYIMLQKMEDENFNLYQLSRYLEKQELEKKIIELNHKSFEMLNNTLS